MSVAEVTIDGIAAGGDGIGRLETEAGSVVVFVPRAAPGDRLRVQLEQRRRFARGVIDDILMPSPLRTDPPCDHYRIDHCGGCQIQHLSYDAQLDAKRGIIRDAITRIGRRAIDPPAIERSDKQWRYRRKLTLALRARRGGWVIGLHPHDDSVA